MNKTLDTELYDWKGNTHMLTKCYRLIKFFFQTKSENLVYSLVHNRFMDGDKNKKNNFKSNFIFPLKRFEHLLNGLWYFMAYEPL